MSEENKLKYPDFIINLDLSKEEHVRFKAKMDKVIYDRGKHNLLTFGVEEDE